MNQQPFDPGSAGPLQPEGIFRGAPERNGGEWKRCFLRRPAETESTSPLFPGKSRRGNEKLARLEAALFVAPEALSTRRLAQVALLADAAEGRQLIEQLNRRYEEEGTAFRVERVAAGYRLMTRPEFARWLQRLHNREAPLSLSPPALETLTIIAYRQPVKRADIEAIRGVKSAEIIRQLMEQGLVRIGGEEETLGRPYLYVTTRRFLEVFGLRTLDDLPDAAQLRQPQSAIGGGSAADSAAADEDPPQDAAASQQPAA